MKRVFKWLLILLAIPLVLVLFALGGLWFLAGTDRGFGIASAEIAKRVPGLELGELGGNLFDGLQGDAIDYSNDAFAVAAKGLDGEWRASCLTHGEFCLDRLVLDEVVFAPTGAETAPRTPNESPIELPAISLPIDVTIDEVLVKRFVFRPPGEAPEQVVENVRLAAASEGDVVTLQELSAKYTLPASAEADPAAPPPGTVTVDAAGTIKLQGGYPIDLRLDVVAEDVVPPAGLERAPNVLRLDLALANTVADLDLDADIGGALAAKLAGRVQPLQPDLPVSVKLTGDALGWPLDTQRVAKASKLAFSVDGTLDDYAIDLVTTLTGEQVPKTALDVAGLVNTERLLLPDVGVKTLGGSVDGTAQVAWKDTLSWLAALDLKDLQPGTFVDTIDGRLGGRLRADGVVADGNWSVNLERAKIDGRLQGYPFELDVIASKGLDDVWRIAKLVLDNGANQVKGQGTVSDAWDLALTARLPQLQNLWPGLGGDLDADVALSGPLREPDLSLDAKSKLIEYQDFLVQDVDIEAKVDEAALSPSSLNVRVGEVRASGQTVRNIALELDGTRDDHALALFADGPEATAVDLKASGALNDDLDWDGLLRSVRLEVPANTIRLREPVAIAWDNAKRLVGVGAHCWVTEGSNLCLENDVTVDREGTARITLDAYPLARLNPFLPAESTLEGALALDATVDWGPELDGGFLADVSTRIDDGGFVVQDAYGEPVSFAYEQFTLDAQVAPSEIDARLAIDSENLGSARADIKLDPSGETKPIEGTISLDGLDIGVAKAFVPDIEEIGGTVSADGRVSGVLTDPRFDGSIVLDSPVVRGEALPLAVTGGKVTTRVRGKRAEIGGEILAGDGTLEVDGTADWRRASWRAQVTLTGESLNVVSPPLEESDVNPVVTIRARPQEIRVDGKIDIPSARIVVAELPEGAAGLSDDIVVIEDVPDEPAEGTDEAGTVNPPGDTKLLVDLDIVLGDEVELSAYGLEALLTGDIGVTLRSPNPVQLAGEIEVVDGVFKKYGQDLEASGRILFVGPVGATRLDIQAIRRIETEQPERIAGLRIEGDVENPDVTLFTEPGDKSDQAILSYIILGRDLGEGGDGNANLLQAAALALTVKGGNAFGKGVADTLGIQEFGLETRGKGDDTELVASGRINDKLLLKYGQSVFDNQGTFYLRYDLAKNLYLEAANGLEQAVDLFYEFSF